MAEDSFPVMAFTQSKVHFCDAGVKAGGSHDITKGLCALWEAEVDLGAHRGWVARSVGMKGTTRWKRRRSPIHVRYVIKSRSLIVSGYLLSRSLVALGDLVSMAIGNR